MLSFRPFHLEAKTLKLENRALRWNERIGRREGKELRQLWSASKREYWLSYFPKEDCNVNENDAQASKLNLLSCLS